MTVGIADINDLVNDESDVKTTQITLYNSAHTERYRDYIVHFMGNTDDNLVSDITSYHLSLSF